MSNPSIFVGRELPARQNRPLIHTNDAPFLGIMRSALQAMIMGVFFVATGCKDTEDVITFGYPVHIAENSEESVKNWAHTMYGKKIIGQMFFENIFYEFIGRPEDHAKIELIRKILENLPAKPDRAVKKVIIIFSDSSEGRAQRNNDGVTIKKRSDGVQYVIFAEGANEEIYRHELLHAILQSEAAKEGPDFITEGVIYDLNASAQTSFPREPVNALYLLSFAGLYPADGRLAKETQNQSAASDLQYYVMRIFWEELAKIDPAIRLRLLNTVTPLPQTMQELPDFILMHTSEEKIAAVQEFFTKCAIFQPPQAQNIFVVPELSADGLYPRIVLYILDENHQKQEKSLQFWYSSSLNGTVITKERSKGSPVKSNHPIEIPLHAVEEGFLFTFRLEISQGRIIEYHFQFNAEQNAWQPV